MRAFLKQHLDIILSPVLPLGCPNVSKVGLRIPQVGGISQQLIWQEGKWRSLNQAHPYLNEESTIDDENW